jgi:hypothetical protein
VRALKLMSPDRERDLTKKLYHSRQTESAIYHLSVGKKSVPVQRQKVLDTNDD